MIFHRKRAAALAEKREEDYLRAELTASALEGVREDLNRADGKVATLTGVAGIASSVLTAGTAYDRIPVPAAIALGTAAALSAVALAVLLTVIWPRLHGARAGDELPSHRRLRTTTGLAALRAWQAEELRVLSSLATVKYSRCRPAIVCLLTATAALGAAVVLIVIH